MESRWNMFSQERSQKAFFAFSSGEYIQYLLLQSFIWIELTSLALFWVETRRMTSSLNKLRMLIQDPSSRWRVRWKLSSIIDSIKASSNNSLNELALFVERRAQLAINLSTMCSIFSFHGTFFFRNYTSDSFIRSLHVTGTRTKEFNLFFIWGLTEAMSGNFFRWDQETSSQKT